MEDRPNVICSTSSFWMWELEKCFDVIAAAGFDAVELMVTRDPRSQSAEVVRRLAKKSGMDIVAVHAPMLVVTRRVWGPEFMKIIDRSTAMARDVGAEVVIVHPPYVWELAYQSWLLGKLDKYTADSGVAIAVENMFRLWFGGRGLRGHRWVSPSDLDRFSQVTLDTSHCGVDEYDILEALDRLTGKIVHIHLSDSSGNHRDSHALPGAGNLPLDQFIKRLPDTGYRGAVSLELDMREMSGDHKAATDALRDARNFCLDHLG
jgi:sugar phosphate isomerase/epimerase